ncbi:MAG TPA: dihydroorotase [Bdellovibrionota bacterium]|nr:dihydroorotase [Bdellovibrionota bacterium]
MLPVDFYVTNVDVWNASGVQEKVTVRVVSGHVDWIRANAVIDEDDAVVIDGAGKALLPAGIDLQVHLRVPGQTHKETAETGLRAALRGGYAAMLLMPNTKPTIDSVEAYRLGKSLVDPVAQKYGLEVWWTAAFSEGLLGERLVDFEALNRAGVWAFTDDGVGLESDDLMDKVFAESARLGFVALQHCEFRGHGAALAAGPAQRSLGLKAYPPEAEADMIARDIKLLSRHPGARYHVLHVSSELSLKLIAEAKAAGLPITAEVTPHHLWFSSEDIDVANTSYKMNPPLRSGLDRSALRRALADGTLDFVSTDHAPHEIAAKNIGFESAAFGTTGMETSLRVLLALVRDGELSRERLVEVFSVAPARLAKKDKEFGVIAPGAPFRALLVDPAAPELEIEEKDLESLSKNNVFLGEGLPGKVETHFTPAGAFRF